MYTTLDFLVQLNARRFIVGGSPELKFRTTNEADTAHMVASYRQLASPDVSFLPTSFESPHSLRPMRECDTTCFESYAADDFITPCLPPFCRRVLARQKKCGNYQCCYKDWWWIFLFCPFSKFFLSKLFSKIFFSNFLNLYTCMQNPRLRTVYRQWKWPLLARVRKIMALGSNKMAPGCKIIDLGWNVS